MNPLVTRGQTTRGLSFSNPVDGESAIMDKDTRVFIASIQEDYAARVREGLEFIGSLSQIDSTTRIAIKPNLTYPTFRPGVMTTYDAVEGLVKVLRDKTEHITIVESDSGGYNPFSISEVF